MNSKNVLAGAACGLVAATLIFVGFLVAGFLPPPSPNLTAEAIAAQYRDGTGAIRAGIAIAAAGSFLLVGWYGAVAEQIRRIEGAHRMLTYTWLIAAAGSMMDFVLPLLFMEVAAFRTEDPVFIQRLNDLGWICFLAAPYIFSIQAVILAVAVLQDRRKVPGLPRWSAYLGLWCALLYLPGVLIVFFKTGPVAWNGIFAWWIPLVAFGAWIVATSLLVIRAARDDRGVPPTSDVAAQIAELQSQLDRLSPTR